MQIRREFTEILTKIAVLGHGVVTPHSDCLEKLALLHEGFI